jgi:plastocyanin
MRRLVTALVLTVLSAFALAACGGDDESSSETSTSATTDTDPAAEVVDVSAVEDGSFAYEQDSLETASGTVNVSFENPAPIAHDFCVEDGGEEVGCTELIADGDTDIAEFELEPGEYTYYCSVAGHRDGGMEGTLTVK